MNASLRRPVIAGNWKLNKTIKEAISLVVELRKSLVDFTAAEIVVCPPFTAIAMAAEEVMDIPSIAIGAQDLYWEEKGAFTGEVSATMIKDAGAKFVIIGHSERRQFFHETDETVNKKTKAALKGGLTPIVCVGESLAEREAGTTFKIIGTQIKGAFQNFNVEEMSKLVIAYEPVWAIGTGKVATPEQAEEVHAFIRKELKNIFGEDCAKRMRILYGGSVKADNISTLMSQEDIDGALVGGASLEAKSFIDIVKNSTAVAVK